MKNGIFHHTLGGLNAGLQVWHIAASPLITCDAQDECANVLARRDLQEFDYIPVTRKGKIIGVLERDKAKSEGTVEEQMRTLEESLLVAAQTPLLWFIRELGNEPYRLVVKDGFIDGIVTRSDLQKLPVRLLTFAYITQLEMLMAQAVRHANLSENQWLDLLNQNRRKKIFKKREILQIQRLDPPLLELTEFSDKAIIVNKLYGFGIDFKHDMKRIKELRNKIAHAATYVDTEQEVQNFVEIIRKMDYWINELSKIIIDENRYPEKEHHYLNSSEAHF